MGEKKLIKKFKNNQWFRAGAGAIITNKQGQVLAFERADSPGSWQFPQGGLDPDEEPEDGAFREVEEETGIQREHLSLLTDEYRLLAYEIPLKYRLHPSWRGQVQYWYIFRLEGPDEVIGLGDEKEFINWKWLDMDELVKEVIAFRRPVYVELAKFMKLIIG